MARERNIRDEEIKFYEIFCSEDELSFILQVPQYNNVVSWRLDAYDIINGEVINLNQYLPAVINFINPVNVIIPRDTLLGLFYKLRFVISTETTDNIPIVIEYYNDLYIGFIGRYISCILGLLKNLKIEDCEFKCEKCNKCEKGLFIILSSFDILKIAIKEEKEEIIRRMYDNLDFYCNFCEKCETPISECISNYGCL